MADNGQRDAGGRLVSQRRMAAAAQADDTDDEGRGTRWELWLLAAAFCGLAYAGATRYAGYNVSELKYRASSAMTNLFAAPSLACASCSSISTAPQPAQPAIIVASIPASATAATAAPVASVATAAPTRSLAPVAAQPVYALDPQGVCLQRGRAELARLDGAVRPVFDTAQISAVASETFAAPATRAAYDVMMACVIDETAERLCESETRGALIGEIAAYLKASRAYRPAAERVVAAPAVTAALSRQVEAGRLQRSHFSAKAGFPAAGARDVSAAFAAAKPRRGGCAVI